MGNAIKYNRRGGSVTVRLKRAPDSTVMIAIEDTGLGIAPEHLGRLFEPFYRVGEGEVETPSQGSSGLGLAIAKSLAQGMGGDILVESTPGSGSTFVLILPSSRPAQLLPVTDQRSTPEPAVRHGDGGTLLYIEDNEVNCLLIEGYLRERPHIQLHCCATGTRGLEAARVLRPMLILVDMHLPDMTGHEVVSAILDDAELHRTPCVAFSADAGEQDVEAAIRSGFREYLSKPVSALEFLDMIDRLMRVDPLETRF